MKKLMFVRHFTVQASSTYEIPDGWKVHSILPGQQTSACLIVLEEA